MSLIKKLLNRYSPTLSAQGRGFLWARIGFTTLTIALLIGSLAEAQQTADRSATATTSDMQVKIETDEQGTESFVVTGLGPEQVNSAAIKVWPAGVDQNTFPSVSGKIEFAESSVRFIPRFALRGGASYTVELLYEVEGAVSRREFPVTVPPHETRVTKVVAIYPTGDRIPANVLKFYVHFSAPMLQGDIYEHIRLQKVDGKEIELPFLEIEQELWSRDAKRLTLLLDPGRIKRGLKPREEMGPIFEPEGVYELVISGAWLDGYGNPLGENIVKKFRTTEEDHEQPDPKKWQIGTVSVGTNEALRIEFNESLDQSMLHHVIEIRDAGDQIIDGKIEIATDGTRFEFTPSNDWRNLQYKLVIDSDLEDLAGNSIGRPFDVDVFEKTDSIEKQSSIEILLKTIQ